MDSKQEIKELRKMAEGQPKDKLSMPLLYRLLQYRDRYEISIQFWPKQTAVYIAKDGVDLQDYGGDTDYAIRSSVGYLDRINGNSEKG